MMYRNLSLLKYCIPCKARCCRTGRLIGSPILSQEEAVRIKAVSRGHLKKILSPTKKIYYILAERKGTNRCFFLAEGSKCKIQKAKPLDCLCYPIKAVYKSDGSIKFITDEKCPAAERLSSEFIKKAKMTALESIRRFDKKTYLHWLDNNVGWVKEGKEIK